MKLNETLSDQSPVFSGGAFKIFVTCAFLSIMLTISACSATSLRCGVDGDTSFVDLVNLPQDISSQSRYFAELCGFAYEAELE